MSKPEFVRITGPGGVEPEVVRGKVYRVVEWRVNEAPAVLSEQGQEWCLSRPDGSDESIAFPSWVPATRAEWEEQEAGKPVAAAAPDPATPAPLTLRDEVALRFAVATFSAQLVDGDTDDQLAYVAKAGYRFADAFLAERAKQAEKGCAS